MLERLQRATLPSTGFEYAGDTLAITAEGPRTTLIQLATARGKIRTIRLNTGEQPLKVLDVPAKSKWNPDDLQIQVGLKGIL